MTTQTKRSTTRRKAKSHAPAPKPVSDAAVYVALVMVGVFVVTLAWIMLQDVMSWTHVLVGYVIAMALLINMYAWQAYAGKPLQNWKESLARLPMRFAGYGTKRGKPLSAAKGQQDAKMMLMVFGAASIAVIAVVTVLLVR